MKIFLMCRKRKMFDKRRRIRKHFRKLIHLSVLPVSLMALTVTAVGPAVAGVTVYESYTSGDDSNRNIEYTYHFQTFVATSTHPVNGVRLKLWKNADYNGWFSVDIRTTRVDPATGIPVPTSRALCGIQCWVRIHSNTITHTSAPGGWYTIEFGDTGSMVEGETYAIGVRADTDLRSNVNVYWRFNSAGTYTDGGSMYWNINAQQFIHTSWDYVFEVLEIELDADDDGIPDEFDLCPDTDSSEVVDANGCSDAQVDADSDGICNPDAPSAGPSACIGSDNAPLDYNPDQGDVDGDGIGDVADPCPSDVADECNPDGSAAESIGVEGGVVETDSVVVTVPEGALIEHTSISVTDSGGNFALVTNQGQAQAVFAVDVQPSGIVFPEDAPVTIVFKWNDDGDGIVDGTTARESKLRISKDGVVITAVCPDDPNCDADGNTFTVTVNDFSVFALISPADTDEDGIADSFAGQTDMCPDTEIPESAPRSGSLRHNRWALNEDGIFDTKRPKGGGTSASFTIEDTAGCSCAQIVDQLGLGNNHLKYGCSTSAMHQWVESVSSP